MTYLFTFTISPVQSFIEQSRKVKDLLSASQILTDLIKVGMEAFLFNTKDFEGEIIYPHYEEAEVNNKPSYPNVFKAKFSEETLSKDQLIDIGKSVERAIRERIREMAINSLCHVQRHIDQAILREQYDRIMRLNTPIKEPSLVAQFFQQLKPFPECYWAFQSYTDDDHQSYQLADQNLSTSLASIKNIKTFEQLHEEPGRKCSLTGTANALFFNATDKIPTYAIKQPFRLNQASRVQIGKGEGLSALGFLKRTYQENERAKTESTAEVALLGNMCSLAKNNGQESEFNNAFSSLNENPNFDYQMLFEEHSYEIPGDLKFKTNFFINKYKKYLKTKYYAMIHFDGDHMGKWMSGEHLIESEHKDVAGFQQVLSQELANLSKTIRKLLTTDIKTIDNETKFGGYTIYAGGDDFLGLVTLQSLFGFVNALRTAFKNLNDSIKPWTDKSITFSMGIVIAHYKTPLSEVLTKVRSTEKSAKNAGRDAFAITALKHSGEIHQSVYKWETEGNDNFNALKKIFESLNDEVVSNKFILQLTNDLQRITGYNFKSIDSKELESDYDNVMFVEIKRLIGRSFSEKSSTEGENKNNSLIQKVQNLWENRVRETTGERTSKNFVHALHIVDFLNRKI